MKETILKKVFHDSWHTTIVKGLEDIFSWRVSSPPNEARALEIVEVFKRQIHIGRMSNSEQVKSGIGGTASHGHCNRIFKEITG